MPSALKHLSTTAALCLCFSALNACQGVPNTPTSSPASTAPTSPILLGSTPTKETASTAMAAALKAARPFANIVSFEQQGLPLKDAGQLEMEIQWPEPDFAIQVIPSSTARLRVRISGGNQPPLEENLKRPLGSVISAYRLIFLSLPSGTNRSIEVDAYDSADKLVATGQVRNVTIQPQQFNRQSITLLPVSGVQPTPPPSGGGGGGGGGGGTPVNRPPVIGGINQNLLRNGADYNGTLSAAASDPEGRPLSYTWTSSAGAFVSNTAAEPQWSGPAGTHTFDLTVSDGVNTTRYSQEITLSPNAPPVVTLMHQSLVLSASGYSGLLDVVASDPESEPLTYLWEASEGSFVNNTGSEVRWSGPPGNHTFNVKVSDGTNTTSFLRTFNLPGNEAPVVVGLNQTLVLQGASYAGNLKVVTTDTESDPLTYLWSATAGSFTSTTQEEVSWSGPAGTHTFNVAVSDGINTTHYSKELTLSPNQAPLVSAITPTLSFANNGYSGTLNAVASDPEAESLTYTWSASAGTLTNNGSAQVSWSGPPGTHTFNVNVSDGTNTTTFSRTVTLAANLPPLVSGITSNLSRTNNSYSGTLNVQASDPENVPLTYTWSADAGSFSNNGSAQASWSGPAGTHLFTVVVSDGFNSVTFNKTITLNANQAPVMGSLNANMSFVGPGHNGTLSATGVSDPDGDALQYHWIVPVGALNVDNQASVNWSQASSGLRTVTLEVSDGTNTTTKTLDVNLANQLPVISDIQVSDLLEISSGLHSGSFRALASDPEGENLSYAWSFNKGSLTSASSANPATWSSGNQSAIDETYTATVTVSDGNTSKSFSKNVVLHNNQAPQMSGIQTAVTETSFNVFNGSLTATATDLENDALTYTWIDDPNTPVLQSLSGATVTLKSNTPPGTYTVQARANDGKLDATVVSRQLVLASGNLPPVINSLSRSLSHNAGTHSGTLSASVSDPENRALSYQWSFVGNNNGASLSNSTSANPGFSGPQGSYTVRLTLTDAAASPTQVVSRDLSFTLTNPNLAPTVTAINAATASYSAQSQLHQQQLTVVASDPENQSLSYVWSTTGGTLSANSGNPVTLTAPQGTYTVSVQANDGVNLSPAFTRQITFTHPNQAPVISGVTPNTTLNNGTYTGSLAVAATDGDGDPLTYTWSVLSGGSTLAANSGQSVNWSASAGTHQVQVIAHDGKTNSAPYVFNTTLQSNQAPVISGIDVDNTLYFLSQSLYQRNLSALASDPEGSPLTYTWSVLQGTPAGSFYVAPTPPNPATQTLDSSSRSVGYRANPTVPYVVQVQVSDGSQISTYSRSVLLGNNPPYVSSANYSVTCAGNGAYSVPITLTIADPDNHAITGVEWTVSSGTLSTGTTYQKTWLIPSAGTHKLDLKISDAYSTSISSLNLSLGGCP